jgi:multicomponent Na+:H+ antiporter subunit G
MIEAICTLMVFAGSSFMLISAIGLARLPGFFERIHAPTKAATLGIICLLTAFFLFLPAWDTALKIVGGILFFAITAPAGAHILARAAYRRGLR